MEIFHIRQIFLGRELNLLQLQKIIYNYQAEIKKEEILRYYQKLEQH